MNLNLESALNIQATMPHERIEDLIWLADSARDCKEIAELGSYRGASARAMLDNSQARIWCIDSWRGSECGRGLKVSETDYELFLNNLRDVLERVVIFKMYTREAVKVLSQIQFDLVFIDADHSYEAVKFDIAHFGPLVRPGGILCGHDYEPEHRPGLVRAVDELIPNARYGGTTIWWTIKK